MVECDAKEANDNLAKQVQRRADHGGCEAMRLALHKSPQGWGFFKFDLVSLILPDPVCEADKTLLASLGLTLLV